MRRHRRLPLLVPLFLLAVACAPAREAGASPVSPLTRVPAADRKAAPDLSGSGLDGRAVSLAGYRGKVVVLNVWASWCGPCRAEAPELSRAQRDLAAEGVQVLGVDTDARRDNGRAFQEQHALSYPSLHDPGSRELVRLPKGYLPQALPFTLFIDRDGRIAAKYLSALTEAEVRAVTRPLLAE
ncbi:TlpA family protein disulfide reductase [Streptomyces fuscichromogenes]|uniref:TlpA family protein disulfide reductase n=1 Tax=Streptomyces fuscichromogenes TaxID=1324013 RepID=UPI001E58636F|nr:TlpA disulfide reductase family protein [Streptomyces fuscichromogenes]